MVMTNAEIDRLQYIEDSKFEKIDAYWATRIGSELVTLYPGNGWEVSMDIKNGICNIFNRHMSPTQGYRWLIKEIALPSLTADLKKIGGEILERFGLSREKFDADNIREIQHKTHGNAKADLS